MSTVIVSLLIDVYVSEGEVSYELLLELNGFKYIKGNCWGCFNQCNISFSISLELTCFISKLNEEKNLLFKIMGNFGLFNQNKETAGCYYQVFLWASSQTYQTQGEIMILMMILIRLSMT